MTGGYDEYELSISDSIETYDHSAGSWVITQAKLPTTMAFLRATNIDNRVLVFGMIF